MEMTQKELDEKVKEVVKQLDKDGFNSPQIVYIMRRTKGRISQILNNKSN